MKKVSILFLILTFTSFCYSQTGYFPMIEAGLSGGASLIKEEGTLTGGTFMSTANFDFIPALQLNAKESLLPRYNFTYFTNAYTLELAEAGILFRANQTHLLSTKYISKWDEDTKLKVESGYKLDYLKETTDEKWTEGLFDNRQFYSFFEYEKRRGTEMRPILRKICIQTSYVRFPNYESLISIANLDENVGTHILDTNNYFLFLGEKYTLSKKHALNWEYQYVYSFYPDQNIVKSDGNYWNTARKDNIHSLESGLVNHYERVNLKIIKFKDAYFTVQNNFRLRLSNQNFMNASIGVYIPEYFNYWQDEIKPSLNFLVGKKSSRCTLGYSFLYKKYTDRYAQSAPGSFLDKKLAMWTHNVELGWTLPFGQRTAFQLTLNLTDAHSNMLWQGRYKYNYTGSNMYSGMNFSF